MLMSIFGCMRGGRVVWGHGEHDPPAAVVESFASRLSALLE
jgi:hypothetical protein